jgi:hypothetical protein
MLQRSEDLLGMSGSFHWRRSLFGIDLNCTFGREYVCQAGFGAVAVPAVSLMKAADIIGGSASFSLGEIIAFVINVFSFIDLYIYIRIQ